ncbi:MAG: GNAT family N-acetyltransferase [Paracoccaceae bacterium]
MTAEATGLRYLDKAPLVEEFLRFRAEAGWGEISTEVAATALSAGVVNVTCRSGETLVGMARVVGDGALYFYVQDVIVHPDWRGNGIGQQMMARLIARIRARAQPGATIGLMAAAGKDRFYEQFGFERRPTDRLGAGMTQVI